MQTENNNVPCNLQQNTLPTPPAVSQGKPQHQTGRLNVQETSYRRRVPWTEAEVIDGIRHRDDVVTWALTSLYDQQPQREKNLKQAIAGDGVGFSKANAATLGRMAEAVLAGRPLSSANFEYCRERLKNGLPRLAKYRKQLLRLLNQPAQEVCGGETGMIPEVMQ
jgi:hypothetical protein